MITQQLKRNHIQETLKGVNGVRHLHFGKFLGKTRVAFVATVSEKVRDKGDDQIRIGLPFRAVTCSNAEYTLGYK